MTYSCFTTSCITEDVIQLYREKMFTKQYICFGPVIFQTIIFLWNSFLYVFFFFWGGGIIWPLIIKIGLHKQQIPPYGKIIQTLTVVF